MENNPFLKSPRDHPIRLSSTLQEVRRDSWYELARQYPFVYLAWVYLLGGLFSPGFPTSTFWWQFLNVGIFLYGGTTFYHAFYSREPGGEENTFLIRPWVRSAALWIQLTGLLFAHYAGLGFTYVYLASMVIFWLFSTPRARWKGHPILSLLSVGLGAGVFLFGLGYLAAGAKSTGIVGVLTGTGVGFIMVSMYPLVLLYQRRTDSNRGDRTFAIEYGIEGVRKLFFYSYAPGLLLVSFTLYLHNFWLGGLFLIIGLGIGWKYRVLLLRLEGEAQEADDVLRNRFWISVIFTVFVVFSMILVGILG